MKHNISNQLPSPASLSIKMPPCYRGLSLAHSHIKPPCSPPDDPNPPIHLPTRSELSYLAPLGSENISAPYFKQFFFRGVYYPPRQSNTTPPSPKTEITNILFYTGCHRRKGPNFGRVFLMLNYTDITQITYIQS